MIYLYIFLCLIASAFFSGMEIAFLSSDKLRLELDRSRGGVSARILGIFYSRPDHFITTMLLGNNVALVIYGLLTAVLMEPWLKSLLGENDGLILLAQSVISTLLILFVGEFLPKVTFRANPNRTMRFFAGILFLVYILLYPFAWIIGLITRAILFLAGQRASSVAIRPQLSSLDLEYYLTHSSDDGQASGIETEVKIIQNAISFSGLQVRDCLLPRNEIVGQVLILHVHTLRSSSSERDSQSSSSIRRISTKSLATSIRAKCSAVTTGRSASSLPSSSPRACRPAR